MTDTNRHNCMSRLIHRTLSWFWKLRLVFFTLIPKVSFADNPDKEYLKYCVANIIEKKYVDEGNSGISLCWACDIVHTLMSALTETIQLVYNATQELSLYILVGGASIWIAVYLLKALGSFATQDPAKVIDGLLTFCFKITLLFVLISFGVDAMMEYIVNPILSIGFDVGMEYAKATNIGY